MEKSGLAGAANDDSGYVKSNETRSGGGEMFPIIIDVCGFRFE